MKLFKLAALLVSAGVLLILNDWEPLDRLLWFAIVLLILSELWSRLSLTSLGVQRTVSTDQAQVGETVVDTITVWNRSPFPRLWIEVRDRSNLPLHAPSRVVHLRGRSGVEWQTTTVCAKRGVYSLGPVSLASGDPFGFFPRTKQVPGIIGVTVFPPELPLDRFSVPAGTLTGSATREQRTPFATPSVSTVRDYVNGDAFNRISWSSSARNGRLMVKEFDIDPTSDLWIVLDLDARFAAVAKRQVTWTLRRSFDPMPWLESSDDYGAAVAATVARFAENDGRAVGLITNGGHREVLIAERGPRVRRRILETLAVARPDGAQPLAATLASEWRRFNRHSGLVVITSSTDSDWIESLALLRARNVHAAVVWIDGASFSSPGTDAAPLNRLVAEGVPSYLVRYGLDIGDSLAAPA